MSKYHKPAESCPVCGGMMGEICEVCGNGRVTKERYGMRVILQPKSKEDVSVGLIALIQAMEYHADDTPKKVNITVNPAEEFRFGVEFRVEWE